MEPNTPTQTSHATQRHTFTTVRLNCQTGNLRRSLRTSVLATARTARLVPRGHPLANCPERLSSVRGASWAAPTPAERSPPAHPHRTPIYDTIEVCVRACCTAPTAAATPCQHLSCLGNAAGQLPTTAGRCRRRWCRLAATAVGAADHHRARRLTDPCRDAHHASPALPSRAGTAAATALAALKMPSSSDVVGLSNMLSILCDTHAARTRLRTGTWIRHARERARIGGGLVRQADRTV